MPQSPCCAAFSPSFASIHPRAEKDPLTQKQQMRVQQKARVNDCARTCAMALWCSGPHLCARQRLALEREEKELDTKAERIRKQYEQVMIGTLPIYSV